MISQKRFIHEDFEEEDLWIDLSILRFLREEMLLGNLDHISLRDPYKQGLFSSRIDCSWERFRRRALYQVGLGFAEPRIVYGPDGEHIDSKKHTGHLCSMRITPFGFIQIRELEKEVKKYEGFNRYITKIKSFNERIMGMKGGIVMGMTVFLIVCIFAFDIKVSAIISKIPLLSSIIDTKVLQEFEAINEQDEFYRAMMGEDTLPTEPPKNASGSSTVSSDIPSTTANPASKVSSKPIAIPKTIKSLIPERVKIENMEVQNISSTEKLFKIKLDNGAVRYVEVKKESGKYEIVGK